jgi:hypothetical protein
VGAGAGSNRPDLGRGRSGPGARRRRVESGRRRGFPADAAGRRTIAAAAQRLGADLYDSDAHYVLE